MIAADLHRLTRSELRNRLTAAENVILSANRTHWRQPLPDHVRRAIGDRRLILAELAARDEQITSSLERMK